MIVSKIFAFFIIILMLQACSSIKKPYSTLLQTPPVIIKTSVGNVEAWKWKPPSTSSRANNIVYLIPGFPGSSLENTPLAKELLHKGYSVQLINPPGHGQSIIGNAKWKYEFPQYGRALFESFKTLDADSGVNSKKTIIAHSAGAEMVMKLLQLQMTAGELPEHYNIVLINPWLPSISNQPIPWTKDDEDILKYSPALITLFGPLSKGASHKRLFRDPFNTKSSDYLTAHEQLTEDLGGWGTFDSRFVRLMIGTTRVQKNILQQGKSYELSADKIAQLRKALRSATAKLLLINSTITQDKVIPSAYKSALKKALITKFPSVNIRWVDVVKGGHMLHVEQPKKVMQAITVF